ncbi:glycosyltransferase [Microbacterium hatanonis]|uniref:Glycosyltransferase n=1 Tax=Microbacterium hatanonis TaxID=404366 RepID=A0A5C8HWS4_9MICO|nr:glycosyltransferase [Microbacterium hatanonis]TXK10318.1 glycosyltransferase [Microbacterium hatanonis]
MSTVVDRASRADVYLVQFEQFSYGRRGFNPEFSNMIRLVKKANPVAQSIVYFHETYAYPKNFRHAIMFAYQRRQAIQLAKSASTVLFTCRMGMARLGRFNPESWVVPVHENIPVIEAAPEPLRPAGDAVRVMVFGNLESRRAKLIRDAFAEIEGAVPTAELWYVGRDSRRARELVSGESILRVWAEAEPAKVSELMKLVDLALSPFPDGISGRRGSFAALMKHAVPTVTNLGRFSDDYLRVAAACGAFVLTSDEDFAKESARLAKDADRLKRTSRAAGRAFQFVPSLAASVGAVEAAMSRYVPSVVDGGAATPAESEVGRGH